MGLTLLPESKYMMATEAHAKLGDISRREPDLCSVCKEDEENYYGSWIEGLGFFDVRFPKATTRELTDEEKKFYNGKGLSINGTPAGSIRIGND